MGPLIIGEHPHHPACRQVWGQGTELREQNFRAESPEFRHIAHQKQVNSRDFLKGRFAEAADCENMQ